MGSHSSSTRKHLRSLFLSCTFFGLLLIVSACARIPNTIAPGFEKIFKDEARSAKAARVDYPQIQMVDPTDKSVKVLVTKMGERFWVWESEYWDQKLWNPVTWYQFSLIEHGRPNAICYMEKPVKPEPKTEMKVSCDFAR